MNQLDHELSVVHLPIDDMRPDPANPRRISDSELDSLTRSMRRFGFVDPVIARREDKTVIGGHQRLLAARRLGLASVPVILLDLSDEQARLLNLALNRISGSWDRELLARLLAELDETPEIDVSLSGFDDDEVAKLLKSLDAQDKRERIEHFDPEAALNAAQSNAVAQPGDLWRMGDHRLLCGDSTDVGAVGRLFGEKRASLMATDPPYLVDYSGGSDSASRSNRGDPDRAQHWDDYRDPASSVEFYFKFLTAGLTHLVSHSAVYQWHAHRRQALVEEAWTKAGLLVHQQIIWCKSRGVLTRSFFLWQHEPCFVGWVEGKMPKRKPPSNVSTIWNVDQRFEQMGIHPTQKPVELFIRPIEYHTEPGEIVYEPFSGSGTQIIAAERTGRVCFAVEQAPAYVDVAVKRWEAFTGLEATRVGVGEEDD
ncbi:MAG: site-specific DNA-methyltransferase [Chloroflexi bacterium]|nr:site-specific DNA-methyltransferase [Chloroflexota bacterium]